MEQKNILIITDYAAPYGGNFIESVKTLDKEMAKENKKIIYLFPKRVEKLDWIQSLINKENFKIYFFKDDTIFPVIKQIKFIIKKEQVNILYTHFCRHKTQLAVKLVRIFNRKIKLVSHFHNHCKIYGNGIKRRFYKIAYKLYEGDLNIGCSESVMKSMPYKKKKITYVDNAINFSRLDNYRDINIPEFENKFVILMFGFDYYRKGVDLAIKAISELNSEEYVLAISLASNKEKVKKNIEEQFGKIPKFVKFLEPINDIASYYRKANLFLSASREEGLCYSIIEAAYCKVSILSSDIPGASLNIPREGIFESTNIEKMKEKIEYFKNNSNEKELDKAKDFVVNKYDLNIWAKKIIEKIDSLSNVKK
jgi:glycosyltransferase involved in cell wall biosynthesis